MEKAGEQGNLITWEANRPFAVECLENGALHSRRSFAIERTAVIDFTHFTGLLRKILLKG